jgi:autotransporter strand-loop-strand O-heptosyltransferase
MKKIKLLYLMPHCSTGGMPQFVLKRIQTLLDYTDAFEIFVIEYHDYGKHFPVQRNQLIELLGNNFISLQENKMRVMEIIRTEEIDIVHLDEMPELMDNDRLFKDLYRNDRTWRIVETCHNSSFRPDTDKRFHPDLYSFCTPWHEDIFGNMDAQFVTIPYLIEESPVTISDIYRDNVRENLDFEKNKKHIVNIGIWTEGKNQAEGIEIARKYPEMMFHFIGAMAGNFQYYWEPLIKDLPSNVKIWREQDNVFRFLIAADIFMFNSTLELNPLVLREAIGYGLPIVARNLPQYAGMYDDYINPIDTDLDTLKSNYIIPTDNTSLTFGLRHEEAYKKILEKPIHQQKVKVINYYVDNPFLEIKGVSDSDFKVAFYDEKDICYYENTIKSNNWVKVNRQYYTKWTARVWQDGELIYEDTLDLNNKRVYIAFESKSLGDTIAWMPYVEEFRKKHQCTVICSTFWNSLFDYPEIEFVEPSFVVPNIYALYRIGYFDNLNKLLLKPVTIPLQKVATAILGLDFQEMIPILAYKPKVPKIGKYVTIATNSTSGMKFWTKEGWQELINWLVSDGYEVYNVSLEPNPFDNCTQITTPSLQSKMDWIAGSEFFIGLSSGLAWVAYAMGKRVVMIANFSEEFNEFSCIRIVKKDVCHGCWNNPNFKFDAGNWNYCPIHQGNDRQFECQNSITSDMVIEKIKLMNGKF